MELKDLKTGMVVKLRNGDYCMVIGDYLIDNDSWVSLGEYNNNLTHCDLSCIDIIEVYKQRTNGNLMPKNWFKYIEDEKPIWRREDEVDWTKVPKWTKVQVRNDDNREWINAYFLGYNKHKLYCFETTICDKFTFEEGCFIEGGWKQCRLYKEEGEE